MKHPKTIEQEVINFIKKHQLINGACKILIGLSGGADSIFALRFFNKYKQKYNLKIAAVHINHNLRDDESDRDEKFCGKICENLNIEYHNSKVNVKTFAKKNKKSIEEAARILRYQQFEEISKLTKSDFIVTAHNSDDNTETVLLNIVNGTGLDGISGIPVKRGKIIRPFLCLSKTDILNYLKSEKINFVQDSSNENLDFDRNYLRKKIIPNIKKKLNPSLDSVVLNSSEIFYGQKKLLNYFINYSFDKIVEIKKDEFIIHLNKLKEFPEEIFGEILKILFIRYFNIPFSFTHYTKIKSLLSKNPGDAIKIKGNIFAARERNEIVIFKNYGIKKILLEIKIGEEVKFNDKKISITKIHKRPEKFTNDKNIEFISGDNIKGKFILRNWQNGDKIKLLGMKGSKKVSDVLTDSKVKSYKRRKYMVLTNNNEVVWLVGLQISDNYKITDKSKSILKLWLN